MTMKRVFALMALTCLISAGASAESFYNRFDNLVRRVMTSGLDSTSIAMSVTSWEIPLYLGIHGEEYRLRTKEGLDLESSSGLIRRYGIGVGYHGLDFFWSKETGGNNSVRHYFEFNFYDNYWGFQTINTIREQGGMEFSTATYGGYFAFNGSEYSYPAAIYGNYTQRRSAGSAMIFLWYDRNVARDIDGSLGLGSSIAVNNFSLCGGYGYNFAFNGGKTVLNTTAAAGLIAPYWGVSAQARLSFIHWFNENIRINASAVQYTSIGWKTGSERIFSVEGMLNAGVTFCF